MGRKKIHDSHSDAVQAYKKKRVDRVLYDVRKDAECSKSVLQAAAAAAGYDSLTGFISAACSAAVADLVKSGKLTQEQIDAARAAGLPDVDGDADKK